MMYLVFCRRRSSADCFRQNRLVQRFLTHMRAVMGGDESRTAKYVQRVREIVHLRQIRGDQDDPRSGLQQFGKKLVDFGLGPDVDTRCWFIENKELSPMV